MPLGRIDDHGRAAEFVSSAELRSLIEQQFPLVPVDDNSGGPARYWRSGSHASRIGFISPHSQNFCSSCNRVRVTAVGRLLLCLGQENSVDLRAPLRASPDDPAPLREAIIAAMANKPLQHDFNLAEEPQILRFMNTTGG
jgi:GTP 3',8-cyclase